MIEHLVFGIVIGITVVTAIAITVWSCAAFAAVINDFFRRW